MPIFLRKMAFGYALMLIVIGVVQLLRVQDSFRRDYHWTPITQRLPLDEGAHYFEVYIGDHQLQTALQAGRLGLKTDGGWKAVDPSDVTIRLNHIDRVTRGRLLAGVACLALALGWIAGLLFADYLVRQQKKISETAA